MPRDPCYDDWEAELSCVASRDDALAVLPQAAAAEEQKNGSTPPCMGWVSVPSICSPTSSRSPSPGEAIKPGDTADPSSPRGTTGPGEIGPIGATGPRGAADPIGTDAPASRVDAFADFSAWNAAATASSRNIGSSPSRVAPTTWPWTEQ